MSEWNYKEPEESPRELDGIRREYDRERLDESDTPADPLNLFCTWMEEATRSGTPDPTAMTLSTVDKNASPSSRIVLLKKIGKEGLVFFTNFQSRKAREIQENARVAAHFYWPQLERQVKISGTADILEDSLSDDYFKSRPFESKISALASPQSKEVQDREFLEREFRKYLEKYQESREVPRPEHWRGFAIKPQRMEFWQGGLHRLHDRIEYTRKEQEWHKVRLAP